MNDLGMVALGTLIGAACLGVIWLVVRHVERKKTAVEIRNIELEERDRVEKQSDDEAWAEFLKNRADRDPH